MPSTDGFVCLALMGLFVFLNTDICFHQIFLPHGFALEQS